MKNMIIAGVVAGAVAGLIIAPPNIPARDLLSPHCQKSAESVAYFSNEVAAYKRKVVWSLNDYQRDEKSLALARQIYAEDCSPAALWGWGRWVNDKVLRI